MDGMKLKPKTQISDFHAIVEYKVYQNKYKNEADEKGDEKKKIDDKKRVVISKC